MGCSGAGEAGYDSSKAWAAMSIEQKLEALTQTVELLARMHVDHEKEYHQRSVRSDERLAQLMEAMTRLTNVVEAHEDRMDDFETE
jgi:hypothetical protein